MAKFVDRFIAGRTSEDDAEAEVREVEAELIPDRERSTDRTALVEAYTAGESGSRLPADEPPASKEATPPPDATPGDRGGELAADYAKIGEHVASVLESARTAAAKIRDDAREDAYRVAERARKEADQLLAAAKREAATAGTEAKRLRSEAEKAAREVRQQADRSAAKTRESAGAEAAEVLARAREEARERTRDARERNEDLHQNISVAEERLVQLAGGLRELAGRLDTLVAGGKPSPTATDGEPESQHLDEALRPSATKPGAAEEER